MTIAAATTATAATATVTAARAARGATSVKENSETEILSAAREMVSRAIEANGIVASDIVSIVFAVTPDLDRAFPARAAREMGLVHVPLLDTVSPPVKGSMPRLIRMLLIFNSGLKQEDVKHVYLGEARALRPDLAGDDGESLDRGHDR